MNECALLSMELSWKWALFKNPADTLTKEPSHSTTALPSYSDQESHGGVYTSNIQANYFQLLAKSFSLYSSQRASKIFQLLAPKHLRGGRRTGHLLVLNIFFSFYICRLRFSLSLATGWLPSHFCNCSQVALPWQIGLKEKLPASLL